MPSRRQLRARQGAAPAGGQGIPARFLRFELSEWIGKAELSTGLRAGGDEQMRAGTLRQMARLVWSREALKWARANGYTQRALYDAQRTVREAGTPGESNGQGRSYERLRGKS